MESIDIFLGVDGLDDLGFVDLFGKRKLHQDAVDGIVGIKITDSLQ